MISLRDISEASSIGNLREVLAYLAHFDSVAKDILDACPRFDSRAVFDLPMRTAVATAVG